jgi:hypothetical protein
MDSKIVRIDRSRIGAPTARPVGDMGQGSREYSFRGVHDPRPGPALSRLLSDAIASD